MVLEKNQLTTLKEFGFSQQEDNARSFAQGQTIFLEGEPGDELFVVLEGVVSIIVQGREVNQIKAGNIFGEMTLVDDRPRSATAQAFTECKLIPLDFRRFMEIVQRTPEFAVHVMSVMSTRMRQYMEEELRQQRMQEELKIGRRIQLSLLPDSCPTIPGLEFAATYRAAREVGGDLYDFMLIPGEHDRLQFVIADVTGKGVPAALFMASARTAFRAESMSDRQPADILARTNRLISLDIQTPLFLSAFYIIVETDTGRVSFANGGHELPYWLRRQTGELETLSASGVLLGAFDDIQFENKEIELESGDFLVFFTDGVTEARNSDGEFYGDERLEQVIKSRDWLSAGNLLEAIVENVDLFTTGTPPADDLTVVVMRRE
jgi:serine phosphatase RsbU (regulator of sigma subunit)